MLAIGLHLEVVERGLGHALLEVGGHAGENLRQDAHGSLPRRIRIGSRVDPLECAV
jgi:hypothetical protein